MVADEIYVIENINGIDGTLGCEHSPFLISQLFGCGKCASTIVQ
jgi:hypothetical protein